MSLVRSEPIRASERIALATAGIVAMIAFVVLTGWAVGATVLTTWLPGLVSMKLNAALCFAALAGGVAILAVAPARLRPVAFVLAGSVVVVAVATIFEHLSGVDLGIDQAVVRGQVSAASPHPGRIAVQTAAAFLLLAAAILAVGRRLRGFYATEALAIAGGLVGAVGLLGYLYGAEPLLDLGSATQVALPATFALIGLGIGLIAVNPQHDLVRQISDPGPAGQVIRRVLPAAAIIVPVGAWIRLLGERAGLYDTSVGLAIMVAIEVAVLGAVGAWTTSSVRRLVIERQQAQLDLVRLGAAVSTPLIETSPVGLAVLDRDLRYLYANPAMSMVDGHEPLAHLGQRVDRISLQLGSETARLLEGVVASGKPLRDVEVDGGHTGNETPGTWLLSAEPLRDETGERIGLALSVTDITERRRREEANAALLESRRQSQVIGDSIPYGTWIADPAGQMRYLSPSFLTLIGRTEEQAQGLGWIDALDHEEAESTHGRWLAAVAAGGPLSVEFSVDGPDDKRHTVLSRGFPIFDEQGRLTSWAGINLDITDRKEAEAFREAFAGILSHELRTPITSIHAAATLLMRSGQDDGQRSELVNDVMEEAERLKRLVEDLVVLTRAERGNIQVHTEPVLLPHVLRKVVERERPRWPDRQIELAVIGSPPVAQAESAFVEQVVRTLIGNAAKFGSAGSRIDVIVDSDGGAPRVRVLDRGPGVDPREAGRLFELFYRSARTAHMPGSGIGLFVAQRLVESMGGSIWARPRDDGQGAEFGFSLPPQGEDA